MKYEKKKIKSSKYHDLEFTFKRCKLDVYFQEDEYSQENIDKILEIVKLVTQEIIIDKTYVNYVGNKHEKTFMKNEGWKDLCQLVLDTKFCEKASEEQNLIILEAYKCMINQYVYQVLQDLGYDTESIYINMKENSRFLSIVKIQDTIPGIPYCGKWQTWKINN